MAILTDDWKLLIFSASYNHFAVLVSSFYLLDRGQKVVYVAMTLTRGLRLASQCLLEEAL